MERNSSFVSVDETVPLTGAVNVAAAKPTRSPSRKPSWIRKKRARTSTILTDFWINAGVFFIFVVIGILMGYHVFPMKSLPFSAAEEKTAGKNLTTAASFKGTCYLNNRIKGRLLIDFADGKLSISNPNPLPPSGTEPSLSYNMTILNHGYMPECSGLFDDHILVPNAGIIEQRETSKLLTEVRNCTRLPVPPGSSPIASVLLVFYMEQAVTTNVDCCVIGYRVSE